VNFPHAYLTRPASELPEASHVPVHILPDRDALFHHFARAIADEIEANNAADLPTRLILPVGPVGQYPILARICNEERIDWHATHTFNMDEYCDWQGRRIPIDHPLSFEGHIRQHLFDQLDPDLRIPEDQMHFPDPLNLDAISAAIDVVGGIDTCYGGIGYHGHVAFNEPPISRWHTVTPEELRDSLTRVVPLAPDTVVMNSIRGTGGNPDALPPMAVTLGMRDILAAGRIRLYCAGGEWQRAVLRAALLMEPTVDYPVTLLRDHPDYKVIADRETAKAPLKGWS
jgi:glucosamine-6-phosphate deaminase